MKPKRTMAQLLTEGGGIWYHHTKRRDLKTPNGKRRYTRMLNRHRRAYQVVRTEQRDGG